MLSASNQNFPLYGLNSYQNQSGQLVNYSNACPLNCSNNLTVPRPNGDISKFGLFNQRLENVNSNFPYVMSNQYKGTNFTCNNAPQFTPPFNLQKPPFPTNFNFNPRGFTQKNEHPPLVNSGQSPLCLDYKLLGQLTRNFPNELANRAVNDTLEFSKFCPHVSRCTLVSLCCDLYEGYSHQMLGLPIPPIRTI
ncbi:unnamed protein product [Gordionus sp. m RMFG-2023]